MAGKATDGNGQTPTKAERAYQELRGRIANGAIPPGTGLYQEQLARDLQMSTTPLRETLRRLESEGFVELSPHRDVRVRHVSPHEMRELYQLRIALEPHAARRAALAASDADVAALQQEIERSPEQPPDLAERYRNVHQLLYAACGNRYLVALLDRLNDRMGRYRAMSVPLDADMFELVETFHVRALSAFAARDADQVGTLVRDHLERVMEGLLARSARIFGTETAVVPVGNAGVGGAG